MYPKSKQPRQYAWVGTVAPIVQWQFNTRDIIFPSARIYTQNAKYHDQAHLLRKHFDLSIQYNRPYQQFGPLLQRSSIMTLDGSFGVSNIKRSMG